MQSRIEIPAELQTFTRTVISISNYTSLKTFLENDGYVGIGMYLCHLCPSPTSQCFYLKNKKNILRK